MWQMVAEQEVQVLVVLTNLDAQDYRPFWPDRPGTSMMWDCGYSQATVSLVSQDDFMPRTIRLRLESNNLTRDLVVVQANNWPQQSSPLSTVFDLIKLVDEEQVRMTVDRNGQERLPAVAPLHLQQAQGPQVAGGQPLPLLRPGGLHHQQRDHDPQPSRPGAVEERLPAERLREGEQSLH